MLTSLMLVTCPELCGDSRPGLWIPVSLWTPALVLTALHLPIPSLPFVLRDDTSLASVGNEEAPLIPFKGAANPTSLSSLPKDRKTLCLAQKRNVV